MERQQIGFIGAGAMAEAIIKGLIGNNIVAANKIHVADISSKRLEYMQAQYGVNISTCNIDLIDKVDTVVMAVKPQFFDAAVTAELSAKMPATTLVVSIMGSVSIAQIQAKFPNNKIIRTMPNTPLAVGAGMTAIVAGAGVDPADLEFVCGIFAACGEMIVVTESQIEAVAAISGCGPGYVFMLIDALADGGVRAGLPRDVSIKLAAQTFMGAGKMQIETGIHPAVLRDQVTSPGGTTIAGISTLEKYSVRSACIEAIDNVIKRSKEIMNEKK